ncbi:hypothetical protein [Hymenobacter latericus]|uniref:hypothetical protein n=1 Tax=Hymenobacter sp. YIM 151858-1 TaxID=2987688 RepID=UPI0022279BDF|nr:hypothetical protein [Hymenobacter sp. YIM 151858-1]UYZ58307.1 hypothetical protein OIS50_14720 [Hymenobacter sp. YIM 151858-1]
MLLLTQCSKCKNDPQPKRPEDQLPPATQTGANTFGCLVNGQPWTPQGNDGTGNYSIVCDPGYNYGLLNVATYRIYNKGTAHQTLGFYSDSVRAPGRYPITYRSRHRGNFIDRPTRCEYFSRDAGTYSRGSFTITRLDLQAGIVSGTFDFTLVKPGCDTVKVTHGRFDKKL